MICKKTISPTKNTPAIGLDPEGRIFIKGRSSSGDVKELPSEVYEWLDMYLENPADTTWIDINLEYIGGFNSDYFISVLKKISQVLANGKKLRINWYYEEGDEDILEKGQCFSLVLDLPFHYIMIKDPSGI